MNLLRLPVPTPRQAGLLVMVALSVGIVTGRALDSGTASAGAPVMLAGPSPALHDVAPGASDSPVALSAPEGNVDPEPADPAPEPLAPEPATATVATEPSEPVAEEPPPDRPPADEPEDSPEAPSATAVNGAVVQVNPSAHGYALATAEGDVIAIHAAKLPRPGELLQVDVLELANGTRKEVSRTATGVEPTAKLRGTVTAVAADQLSYVVSARGASMLVQSAAGRPLPAPLDLVTVEVRFADPQPGLLEETLAIDGQATGAFDLHGTIASVDPATHTLVLPADDLGRSGLTLSLAVAAEVDLSRFAPGDVIAATARVDPAGGYELTDADPDDDARAADRAD